MTPLEWLFLKPYSSLTNSCMNRDLSKLLFHLYVVCPNHPGPLGTNIQASWQHWTLLYSPLVTGPSRFFQLHRSQALTTWLSFPESSPCGMSSCTTEENVLFFGDEVWEGTLFLHAALPETCALWKTEEESSGSWTMDIILPVCLTHELYEAKQKHMAVSPISPGLVHLASASHDGWSHFCFLPLFYN